MVLLSINYRQIDPGWKPGRKINGLGCFDEVCFFRFKNIWNKFLRITIYHRKPAALDLDHEPMTLPEHVIYLMKINDKFFRFTRGKSPRAWKNFSGICPGILPWLRETDSC